MTPTAQEQALEDARYFADLRAQEPKPQLESPKPDTSYRLPPLDWRDADQWQFLGFIMHRHCQQCRCGARHEWSETLRLFGHKTYVASRGHRLMPFVGDSTGMPQNEPLAVYALPDKDVVICHKCLGGYRAAGEDVIELRAARDEQNWIGALLTDAAREREAARRSKGAPSEPKEPAKPKTPSLSLSDLMKLGG